MRFYRRAATVVLAGVAGLASAAATHLPTPVHPTLWPASPSRGLIDRATEARIAVLMKRMTLEEKVGQMIQADIGSITPEDLKSYPLGSILAGGSSPPLGKPDRSGGQAWLDTARAFDVVAMRKQSGHVAIPLMFGVDAVHGNNKCRWRDALSPQ